MTLFITAESRLVFLLHILQQKDGAAIARAKLVKQPQDKDQNKYQDIIFQLSKYLFICHHKTESTMMMIST